MGLSRATPAGAEVQLQVAVAQGDAIGGVGGLSAQGSPAQVGVQNHPGRVDHVLRPRLPGRLGLLHYGFDEQVQVRCSRAVRNGVAGVVQLTAHQIEDGVAGVLLDERHDATL